MCAVLTGDAVEVRRAPGRRAVIGAARHQDLAPARSGTCDGDALRGGVGAVLLEHRPARVRYRIDQKLGELDDPRRWAVLAIAERLLARRCRIHLGMTMAQDDRPIAAHEVDVLVAIDVEEPATPSALQELRK